MQNLQDVQRAAKTLAKSFQEQAKNIPVPEIGIILGTGLGESLAAEPIAKTPFSCLPNFPVPLESSHKGIFILANISGKNLLIQQGRCHLYEGYSPYQICMGVRVMHELGVKTLIITNAAGALNPLFEVGSLMCIADIINFTGFSPLTGQNCPEWGERFPDMSAPFDAELQKIAINCAKDLRMRLELGVYIAVHGPEMETPAETRMYRQWGADAIGMSSSLELITARHLGMRVLGISALTNKNLPDCMKEAPIEEVIRQARKAGEKLENLITAICKKI